MNMTSHNRRRTVRSNGWGGAGISNDTRRLVSRCREDLDTEGGALQNRPRKTTATGEDEVEQSLRLALLAGKDEALGQSSQSKCESWRLKAHFPSSSPVWRGAIQQVSESLKQCFTAETTVTVWLHLTLSNEADSDIKMCTQGGQGWMQPQKAICNTYKQDQEHIVVQRLKKIIS